MMNQEDLFKKIGSILQELQDQYDFLAENPQQLNELELELFQANASFLSDHIQIIKKVNNNRPVKELPPPDVEVKAQEPVKPVMDELFKPDQESATFEFVMNDQSLNDKFDFEEKPVYEIFDRPLSPEEQEIISRKQQLLANQERGDFDLPAATIPETAEDPLEEELVSDTISTWDKETEDEDRVVDTRLDLGVDDEFVAEPGKESFAFDFHNGEDVVEEDVTDEEVPVSVSPESSPINEPDAIEQVDVNVDEEDEDEIGPEPFLVVEEKPLPVPAAEPIAEAASSESPGHKQTLNELLAASASASKNTGFERSRLPVTDLKSAINLNQKLLYIKDLFNGYNLAYAEVIDILNKMPDFKTADNFLQANYAVKNNWASKPGTVEQFYELLRLRFPD